MLQRQKPEINDIQEWVLSYLVGLGPLRTPISVKLTTTIADMENIEIALLRTAFVVLEKRGAIIRLNRGDRRTPARFMVLKRPEDFQVKETWVSTQRVFGFNRKAA